MAGTNRWLGLAVVGLLALLAQPAAVTQAPVASASTDDPGADPGCSTIADLEEDVVEELAPDVHARTPADEVCLDEIDPSSLVEETLDDVDVVLP